MSAVKEKQMQLENAKYQQKTAQFLWPSQLHMQKQVPHSQPTINMCKDNTE